MLKDFLNRAWQLFDMPLRILAVIIVFLALIVVVTHSFGSTPVTVRQVVIVKGYTPLSLQTAVNQMLRDSSFVNVRLDYASLPYYDVVMLSHDVQVAK